MARSKKMSLNVIFFGPQNFRGRNKYYDRNGKVTDTRTSAAYFYTFEDAKEFADKMKIKLSEIVYIGLEDFTQHEIEMIQANLNRGFLKIYFNHLGLRNGFFFRGCWRGVLLRSNFGLLKIKPTRRAATVAALN